MAHVATWTLATHKTPSESVNVAGWLAMESSWMHVLATAEPMVNRIRDVLRQIQTGYKRKALSPSEQSEPTQHYDLPQEIEEGNVEYKLQLLAPAPGQLVLCTKSRGGVGCSAESPWESRNLTAWMQIGSST